MYSNRQYLSSILPPTTYIKHADKFVAGAGAGVTAVALTYPLDTIRARLAFQVTGEHKYTGIAHTASTIFKQVWYLIIILNSLCFCFAKFGFFFVFQEGGIRALYRGFVPTLMGMVPYAGFSFYCFEMVKFVCMKYSPLYTCNKCDKNTGKSSEERFLLMLSCFGIMAFSHQVQRRVIYCLNSAISILKPETAPMIVDNLFGLLHLHKIHLLEQIVACVAATFISSR